MDKRKIYFDEALHKYTDEFGNTFTSVTTVIGKYVKKFDTDKMARICASIGKNRTHPKYLKYKGKSEKQLKEEWANTTEIALINGNEKHNYLEDTIKASNNYDRVKGKFIKDRLFTLDDIREHPEVGVVTLDKLIELKLDTKYPDIFKVIKSFINDGWKLYSEIGVYNTDLLISGLIDLLLVKGDTFVILDWKTNKSPITYKSGYYEKDVNGNITSNFIENFETLLHPLTHIPASVGYKYALQLSSYSRLVEEFGFKCGGILLSHIRTIDDKETTNILPIKYMRKDIDIMFEHHTSNNIIKTQGKLFV